MSYILDALTKAAQQRERQVPVVQRLLSPPAPLTPWIRVPGRSRAALAAGAALLAVLVVWWLLPVSRVAPPPDRSSVMAAAPTPVLTPTPTPRSVVVEPAPPVGRLESMPRADLQPSPREGAAIADAPVATPRPAPVPAPGSRSSTPLAPPTTTAAPPPAAAPPAAPPGAPARAAASAERSGLRLEALIYSDVPAQRMVFINGRRYVEGDMVDGRLRIEEIQDEGVELSDQGRRFILRATR